MAFVVTSFWEESLQNKQQQPIEYKTLVFVFWPLVAFWWLLKGILKVLGKSIMTVLDLIMDILS